MLALTNLSAKNLIFFFSNHVDLDWIIFFFFKKKVLNKQLEDLQQSGKVTKTWIRYLQ